MKKIKVMMLTSIFMAGSKIMCMQSNQLQEVESVSIKEAKKFLTDDMDAGSKKWLQRWMLAEAIYPWRRTPDNYTCSERLELIEFLIENGAELNPKTNEPLDVPMLAAVHSDIGVEVMALLIKHGANINATHPYHGKSALHLLKFLLNQENIQINLRDNEKKTPLICAAFCCWHEAVKELLQYGADTTAKDLFKQTALDYAESCCDFEVEGKNNEETVKSLRGK